MDICLLSSLLNLHHAPPSMERWRSGRRPKTTSGWDMATAYRNIVGGGSLFVVQIQWALPSGEPLRENGATLASEFG